MVMLWLDSGPNIDLEGSARPMLQSTLQRRLGAFDALLHYAAGTGVGQGRSLLQMVIVMAMVVAMALGEPSVRKHRRPTGLALRYN